MARVKEKINNGNSRSESESRGGIENRTLLIQMLIPIALEAVNEELQSEVSRLAGSRYRRSGGSVCRWGYNPGSVNLGGQKVSIKVPRLRDGFDGKEVTLESYHALRDNKFIDESTLSMVLNGLSQRKYEKVSTLIPETFGIKHSSVSKRFIRASARKLQEFMERDLSGEDIVSIFIDGKRFAENGIIIALGIKLNGEKLLLGFIESGTENHQVCYDFINQLIERGLRLEKGILVVIDGSKGLYKGVKDVLGGSAFIQRCQWHKRENVIKYLDKKHHDYFRMKLQQAYQDPYYEGAKTKLMLVRKELGVLNESAVRSLDEGLEETLTLHRLGMFKKLGRSFKTTNCIESINQQLEMYTGRVCRWRNSNQRQRWVASALLEIEPSLRKVDGYKHLEELRSIMTQRLKSGKGVKVA